METVSGRLSEKKNLTLNQSFFINIEVSCISFLYLIIWHRGHVSNHVPQWTGDILACVFLGFYQCLILIFHSRSPKLLPVSDQRCIFDPRLFSGVQYERFHMVLQALYMPFFWTPGKNSALSVSQSVPVLQKDKIQLIQQTRTSLLPPPFGIL